MKRHIIRTIVSTLTLTVFTCTLAGCSSKARQDESSSSTVTESTAQETQTDVTESIAGETQPVTADINIAVMTGPTAIGLVKVMKDNEDGVAANNYNFQVFGEATEISTGLVKGELEAEAMREVS